MEDFPPQMQVWYFEVVVLGWDAKQTRLRENVSLRSKVRPFDNCRKC